MLLESLTPIQPVTSGDVRFLMRPASLPLIKAHCSSSSIYAILHRRGCMASSSSRLVYDGAVLRIEFYLAPNGCAPTEAWLEQLSRVSQQKFAALFARMGDTGKIWNERKFKHLTETDQIFEFKVEADRILRFFFIGRRLILTHGFRKW